MTALTVTARFDTACIGLTEGPVMLDGPLAWAYAQRALARRVVLPRLTAAFAPDFPLPLDRHDVAGDWVWCTSRAHVDIAGYTTLEVRRKPATQAMSRYARDRTHHAGLGAYKARDSRVPAALVRSATWHVAATDRGDLEDLLGHVTHIGARHRNGLGHVTAWEITESTDPDGWRSRPMPTIGHGTSFGVRAPYWHSTRHRPCVDVHTREVTPA